MSNPIIKNKKNRLLNRIINTKIKNIKRKFIATPNEENLRALQGILSKFRAKIKKNKASRILSKNRKILNKAQTI